MSCLAFVPRRAASAVADALADTRVVLINGARQAGKSTLVRAVAGERTAEWRDLDLPQDRQSALTDPVGFVSFDDLMVIDEIQRAPELLLAIKATVDTASTRGFSPPAIGSPTRPGHSEHVVEISPVDELHHQGHAEQQRSGVLGADPADGVHDAGQT